MSVEIRDRKLGRWQWEATRRLTEHTWRVEYRRTRWGARRAVRS